MTIAIRIYPNKLDGATFETCHTKAGQTLEAWLFSDVPNYQPSDAPLFSARVNGALLAPDQWATYRLQPGDAIDLTVEAKEPATIALVIIAVVAVGAAIYMSNQIPDNYSSTTPDGSSIYDVNAQGNKPRLMGVIPEIAGRHKVFPDLLTQPRRRYEDNEQWLYMLLAVGVGEYETNGDEIYIGNTPIGSYAGDMNYTIYGPGESSAENEAAKNYYSSAEVGGTSGTSGIELKGKVSNVGGPNSSAAYFDFTGTSIRQYDLEVEGHEEWYTGGNFPFSEGAIVDVTKALADNVGSYRITSKTGWAATVEKVDANGDAIPGWPGFTAEYKTTAEIVAQNGGGDGEYNGPFFACPESETTDKIELDFKMAQGLGELDDNGDYISLSVTIRVEYRDEGALEWEVLSFSFVDSTPDQLGETRVIALGEMIRPEVRVKRITAARDDTRVKDKIEWVALRAALETPESYDDITTIALKIKGTNNLASSAENKFNMIVTRLLPTLTGEQWNPAGPTRDIAAFFAHVIKDCGHTDDVMDLESLGDLSGLWASRGDNFDAVFDSDSTLFETLKRALAPGYAEPTIDFGQILPVRDEVKDTYEHMYQPHNMLKPGLSRDIKFHDADELDGIEVEYFNPETWKAETVLCLLPEDTGARPKKVRAFGITDKTKAWRYGMRQRRIARYRRVQYKFKTEMDGLNSRYLSYCALADDIPGYSQTGQVTGVNGLVVTLNESVTFGAGTHFLAMRKPDGTLSGAYTATAGAEPGQVVIDRPLDFVPDFSGRMELPLFMFGSATRWTLPALITDISPQGTDRVSLTAVNYAPEVYLDDDNDAPL